MRDSKNKTSARIVLDGYMTHYNFFMEHDYLKGITPAQAGSIGDGITNWGDLIEFALNTPKEKPKVKLEWEKIFQVE